MKFISWAFLLGFPLTLITPVFGYEEATVTNGGTITGKVTLAGKNPPALA